MKLPQLKPQQVIKALKKAGFVETRRTGSHRHFHHPDCRRTQVSVHPKTLFKGTLRAILRQTELSLDKLLKLVK
ncbi:type II toxin-antitoxin system HicA family toxin [Candidatus Parcubacteria bacterium]|nr:type II toxin-antitoxin system HicA family toxin [Candidatus Parcubacteria bacterium]